MATRRRTKATNYQTYGSMAYAPAYAGSAVRAPGKQEGLYHPPAPKVRKKVRQNVLTRTRVQVREAGKVSPFAVVGFMAVALFAAMVVMSYAQHTALSDEVVSLRSEISALETERADLAAEYERIFDLASIQAAVGDAMVRPATDQVVYIDLSEPDSVVLYGQDDSAEGVEGFFTSMEEIFHNLIEYFN